MRITLLTLAVLSFTACDSASFGEAAISGTVGDADFGDDVTVFHGTRHVVLINTKMDCLDVAWISRNYFSDDIRSDLSFAAVQFTFDGETPESGNFSLDGNSAVTGWFVDNLKTDTNVLGERAREGLLEISVANDDEVVGEFQTTFGEGGVQGSFTSVHCRNVR